MIEPREEETLIRRAARGDRGAFSSLVLAYQGGLRAFCARYGPSLEAADDVAQDAFLRAFQGLARFQVGTDFGKWLRGIARHVLLDALRREGRDARVLKDAPRAVLADRLAQRVEAGEADEDTSRRLRALTGCLEKLEEGSRELVRVHYQEELAAAEIARRLGKGPSGMRMQLLRIRKSLRRCIDLRLKEATS